MYNQWSEVIDISHSSKYHQNYEVWRKEKRWCFPISFAFLLLSTQSSQAISDGVENKCWHAVAFFSLKCCMLIYFSYISSYFYKIKGFTSYFIAAVLWIFLPFLTAFTTPANVTGYCFFYELFCLGLGLSITRNLLLIELYPTADSLIWKGSCCLYFLTLFCYLLKKKAISTCILVSLCLFI